MEEWRSSKCPACGLVEVHRETVALKRQLDGLNILFWLFGGFIFSLLFSLARRKQFMCVACDHRFSAWPLRSRVWTLVLLVLLGLLIWGVWLEYSGVSHDEAPIEADEF